MVRYYATQKELAIAKHDAISTIILVKKGFLLFPRYFSPCYN